MKYLCLFLIAWTAVACVAGCSPESDSASNPPRPSEPVAGGTLIVADGAEPDVLNSLLTTSGYSTRVNALLHDGLVSMNTRLELEPLIADSWSWSDDGLAITFHLKRGVRWSDGAPFSAYDVESSYGLYTDPRINSARRSNFADMETVAVVDSHTVVIRYAQRTNDQLFNAAFTLFPKHIVEALDPERVNSWEINRQPVGLGPFRLARWDPGEQLILERNPYYWGGPKYPYLERIIFKFTPEQTVRLLRLEAGEVDMLTSVPLKDYDRLRKANRHLKFYPLSGRKFGYLLYNMNNPILADVHVRRAISHAVDRRAFIDNLMYGYGQPAASVVVPVLAWAHDSSLEPDPLDPEKARALLAQAGWTDDDGNGMVTKDGERLVVTITTRTGDPVRENGVIVLQDNLRRVGIEANLRLMEHSASLQEARDGNFDIFYAHFASRLSVDPTMLVTTGGQVNYGKYSNPQIDDLVRRGVTEFDPEEAKRIWFEFQALFAQEQPWTMLYYYDDLVAISDRFVDCTPDNLSPLYGVESWWAIPGPGPGR